MGDQSDDDLFISSLAVGEIRRGILEKPHRHITLAAFCEVVIYGTYAQGVFTTFKIASCTCAAIAILCDCQGRLRDVIHRQMAGDRNELNVPSTVGDIDYGSNRSNAASFQPTKASAGRLGTKTL